MQSCLLRTDFLLSELRFVERLPRPGAEPHNPSHIVLFEPRANTIRLSAATEMGFTKSVIPVIAGSPPSESFAITAKNLVGLLTNVRAPLVKLSILEDQALFEIEKAQWRFKILPTGEAEIRQHLVAFDPTKFTQGLELRNLESVLRDVSRYAARRALTRYNFKAIHLTVDSLGCRAAACDGVKGFYSAPEKTATGLGAGESVVFALPRAFVPLLRQITPVSSDPVLVEDGDQLIRFICEPRSVGFKLAEGGSPPLERLISVPEGSVQIDVIAEELYAAVCRVRVAAQGPIRPLYGVIDPHSDLLLRVESALEEQMEVEEDVPARSAGQAEFMVNSEPLKKFLRNCSGSMSIYVPACGRKPVIFVCSSSQTFFAMQFARGKP